MTQSSWILAKAFGYLSYPEVLGLKAIGMMLPKGAVCVNLGAGSGTSSLAICEDRDDLIETFHTVDISQGGAYGGLDNETNAFLSADILKTPIQHLADSVVLSKTWTEPITYLFIDDDHEEGHLREEIENWFPKLAPDCIVAFHDYGSPVWPGVKSAVDDLVLSKPEWIPMYLLGTLMVFRRGRIFKCLT